MNTNRLTIENGLRQLAGSDARSLSLFRHGSLEVKIYQPQGKDPQQPHERDEVYVVIAGRGWFVNGANRQPFEAGEVLFVPAGVVHRFEDFTDDFATWVCFYGPRGGESAQEEG